ncbi:uncharacterized protein MEPE_06791 [Melanopsichium pennsylvanicum]|uniref:WLM domain-containing protein n=2 Tax=Melanopsichium pennsylvanicum TaxID=63383 RepID=A0AAJ5C8J6_9BASI|nr:conserved hypothetical protein [Melanopsichium pennsylvanicum 4]SNX88080.1 uncharacterized protein MEPE_06791 [Melanopsichium pennsylvanicum]
MDTLNLIIVYRRQEQALRYLTSSSTVYELRQAIEKLIYVPTDKQKLLLPRSAGVADLNINHHHHDTDTRTLVDIGLAGKHGVKITVLGPSSHELETLYQQETEMQKRNAPRQYHPSMLRGTKPRSTTTPGCSISPFGTIYAHPTTPASSPLHSKITDYLSRLSRDPGILHICALHNFRIGALTELLPWEHPGLLGLNENAGQRILLRIRTDDAEGFRDYKTSRRVLVHELAHNKIADHPPEFKILNSELNAQIAAFEQSKQNGAHQLIEGHVYEPSAPTPCSGSSGGHRLGGTWSSSNQANTAEERRQRILMATMRRLEREEQEIEQSCGSAAHSTSKSNERSKPSAR